MTLSMFGYVVNDSLIKLAVEDVPLFQAIFVRGVFVMLILAATVVRRRLLHNVRDYVSGPLLLRISMEAIGTVLYLTALSNAPLAGLTAMLQVVPVAVTFVAARLLRERVSWNRVFSVVVGFVGVLIIIRPGSTDFNPWFLVGLLVVITIVVRELATTKIPADTPSAIVSLGTAIAIMTVGGLGSAAQGWGTARVNDVGLLFGAACFLTLGYIASVITVRTGELSFSAPFRYTVMVFAIVLQIIVFDDIPDVLTFVGTALITAAGLYAFRTETRAVQSPPTRPQLSR
jgi:drug/metabolite transporter (DMT)-like permease